MTDTGQCDLLTMLQEDREATEGVPKLFALECGSAEEFEAAFDRWTAEYGHFGSIPISHAWHKSGLGFVPPDLVTEHGCEVNILSSDTRCHEHWSGPSGESCQCVGDLLYRAVCGHCRWLSPVGTYADAVLAVNDHCFDGWRDSPVVVPAPKCRDDKAFEAWTAEVVKLYGDRPRGYPVITERTGIHSRAGVAGWSPWGGYDVSAAAV